MKRYDCIGIGLATLDHLSLVTEFPRPGLKLEVLDAMIDGGGPVATAMAALSRLGRRCAIIGKLGADVEGQLVMKSLRRDGVDTRHILLSDQWRTPAATVLVERMTGRRTVLLKRSRECRLSATEIHQESISRCRALHLDGRDLAANRKAATAARKMGVTTFLDVGSLRNPVDSLFPHIDHLVTTEEYAIQSTGRRSVKKAIIDLWQPGMKALVVTRGAEGATAYDGTDFFRQRAYKIRVVDTTGAGDAYHGAYIHAVLSDLDIKMCLRFAAAVAALNCRELGGRRGLPTLAEAEKFMMNGRLR